ncbi:MAG: substrate-binding domain-containing protein, partial [Deltaproteobacteria bacterium]|nr:substrate-binding domain-containing protein [Deltaproteobacteria bacterium]
TVAAEQFGKTTKFKTPKVESTGSGGGLKLFCAGVGVEHPDMTNSSRRIKKSEVERCGKNGVREIVELKVGYDGIAVANSKKSKSPSLTPRDLFLALAKDVPANADGSARKPNPYKTWKDVNAKLPDLKIEVLGPPPTSGTRDAFVELVMDAGCKKFAAIKKMSKKPQRAACRTMREDGAFVEAGENDNLIVQKLDANPNAFGIFGFSFLDQNTDKLHGASINGVKPEFETIADGSYPVARPLYIYIKKAHLDVIAGMREFLAEYTSEKAWGDEGYLTDKGLIPMPKKERQQFSSDVKNLKNLAL